MIDTARFQAEVERQYIATTANLSNRRRTVPDFKEVYGVRLVKWGVVLRPEDFPDGDEEAIAAEVVERIVDFERGLLVGVHSTRPSQVARCFLKGHEVPSVGNLPTDPETVAQIKVVHVFGVQQ